MPAYDMRISDWSSDVCSSDLIVFGFRPRSRHRGRLRRTARRIAVIIGGAINDHLVDAIARVIADLLFAGIAGGWRSDLRHLAINRADRRRVVILIGDDFYYRDWKSTRMNSSP